MVMIPTAIYRPSSHFIVDFNSPSRYQKGDYTRTAIQGHQTPEPNQFEIHAAPDRIISLIGFVL
jgi:hypothetical protein